MPILDTTQLHPSTLLCLEAMQQLHERESFSRILDLGCGDGLLSMVAAQLWPGAKILAADVSQNAVNDARKGCKTQRTGGQIDVIRSDGFSNPLIYKESPYDLLLCNLLAETLLENAHNIKKNINKSGFLILSGILEWKRAAVEDAYNAINFRIINKIQSSPWVCLVLRNTIET